MNKNTIWNYNTVILILAFLIGGFLHVALWGVAFTTDIVRLYYGIVISLWIATVQIRIIDNRVCSILSGIGMLSILYFAMQMGKYTLFASSAVMCRLLWYAYYIPMIGIPLLLLVLAVYMNRRDEKAKSPVLIIVALVGILLMLGFLTNDMHGLALYTPGGVLDESNYSHGVLYFIYVAYVVLISVVAYIIILRKCHLSAARRHSWMPLLVVAIGVAGLISVVFEKQPKIAGISIWRMAEMYVFMSIITLEACIQIGMISCNIKYRSLLQKMTIPVEIRNLDKETVITTEETMAEGDKLWIQTLPIDGGYVSWALDMSRIYELNERIDELTAQVALRNQYLQTQNSIIEEQTVLDARNLLYTHISQIVRPQLLKIDELLVMEDEDGFEERLAKITVLNAYIKRRSNIELIKGDKDSLSLNELRLAFLESADYLKLCNIDMIITSFASGQMPSEMITLMYEFFEDIVERCLDNARAMLVALILDEGLLTLRMLIQAETLAMDAGLYDEVAGYRKQLSITKEGDDTIIVFSLEKGGVKK